MRTTPQTPEDYSRIIESCIIASVQPKPSAQVIDTPELYRLANLDDPNGYNNGVFRVQFAHDAERMIDEQYQFFRTHGLNFRWVTYPHSRPEDLNAQLQRLAPTRVREVHGLYAAVGDLAAQPSGDVTVEELSDANLEEYIETVNAGWEASEVVAASARASIRRQWTEGYGARRSFLARYRGSPATIGSMFIVNGIGYINGAATRPEFRGKGVYRALVRHRMAILRAENVPLACVFALADTSSPICRRLGFQVGCECREYKFHLLDVE